MKRYWILVLLAAALLMIPVTAMAGCQCVQPTYGGQTGFEEATCTSPGYFVLECDVCGGEYREKAKDALGHDYQQVGVLTPTCGTEGAYYLQCTRCGDEETVKRPATGNHDWVLDHINRDDVECVADGTAYYHCSVCMDQKNEPVYATGHNWKAVSALAANCQTAKVVTYQCSKCNDTKTETEGSKTDHSWQQTYFEPATCAADGYKSYKCAFCSETKMETLPATGKCTWGNWITVTAATCGQDGLKVAECTVCGDTKKETISATGNHNWNDNNIIQAATCTKDGKASSICTVCGKTEGSRTIPKLGHSWGSPNVTNATCTAEGKKVATCTRCGEKKTESISALGHNWKNDQIIKPATCTENGIASSVCTRCNATDNNRTIEKLGHKWGAAKVITAPTCTAEGKSQSSCKTCGETKNSTINATGHSWGEWKVIKEATETKTGLKERTCKTCGDKETQTIPKKGAAPTATPQPPKKPSSGSNATANLEAEYGMVEVFTTSGKVNLRSGPSRDNKRVTQVDKRNTCLGELLDAEADNKGVVWFKVKYKNKTGWITSDYAKAVVGELDGNTRRIEGKETELTNLYLKSVDEALDALTLEEDGRYDIYETEVSNDAVLLCGNDYVEVIELTGEGYTIYGVKVGDKIKDAQKKFKKVNLVLDYDSADEHVYNIICSQDSLFIDECGFDGTLTVVVADGKVESMRLEASSPAEE